MKLFHCGASSKYAGKKITTITEIRESEVYVDVIKVLMGNHYNNIGGLLPCCMKSVIE